MLDYRVGTIGFEQKFETYEALLNAVAENVESGYPLDVINAVIENRWPQFKAELQPTSYGKTLRLEIDDHVRYQADLPLTWEQITDWIFECIADYAARNRPWLMAQTSMYDWTRVVDQWEKNDLLQLAERTTYTYLARLARFEGYVCARDDDATHAEAVRKSNTLAAAMARPLGRGKPPKMSF